MRGGEWRRVRVCRRGRVVLPCTDQAVLSVSGGMVERTGGLQQVRHRKCQQVIICLLSPGSHSPAPRPSSRPPSGLRAVRPPWQSPIHTVDHQTTVQIVQQLRPGGGVTACPARVVLAVRRGLHLLGHHGGGLGGEVGRGGRSHALPPPGWQGQGAAVRITLSNTASAPGHLQLLHHWKV